MALLRAHLARNSTDERALVLLVRTREMMVDERSDTEDTWAEVAPAKAGLEDLEPDVLALGRVARSAHALNVIAWHFALLRRPEVGLGFARRSLEIEPQCSGCKDTLALLLAESGRFDEAVTAEEAVVVDGGPEKAMLDRLARFRALSDEKRGSQ